jgi:hypothetical protein
MGALLAETLRGRRWRACEINGERTAELNEAARIAFQTGECDWVTTVAAILSSTVSSAKA